MDRVSYARLAICLDRLDYELIAGVQKHLGREVLNRQSIWYQGMRLLECAFKHPDIVFHNGLLSAVWRKSERDDGGLVPTITYFVEMKNGDEHDR